MPYNAARATKDIIFLEKVFELTQKFFSNDGALIFISSHRHDYENKMQLSADWAGMKMEELWGLIILSLGQKYSEF